MTPTAPRKPPAREKELLELLTAHVDEAVVIPSVPSAMVPESGGITIDRLQAIVLRLANQSFVRYYLWLNYPNEPQHMGIEFLGETGRVLEKELTDLGFKYHQPLHVWAIERNTTETPTTESGAAVGHIPDGASVASKSDGGDQICRKELESADSVNARLVREAAPEMYEALKAYETLDDVHANCPDCEGTEAPEACEHCFPFADAARLKMRAAIAKAESRALLGEQSK